MLTLRQVGERPRRGSATSATKCGVLWVLHSLRVLGTLCRPPRRVIRKRCTLPGTRRPTRTSRSAALPQQLVWHRAAARQSQPQRLQRLLQQPPAVLARQPTVLVQQCVPVTTWALVLHSGAQPGFSMAKPCYWPCLGSALPLASIGWSLVACEPPASGLTRSKSHRLAASPVQARDMEVACELAGPALERRRAAFVAANAVIAGMWLPRRACLRQSLHKFTSTSFCERDRHHLLRRSLCTSHAFLSPHRFYNHLLPRPVAAPGFPVVRYSCGGLRLTQASTGRSGCRRNLALNRKIYTLLRAKVGRAAGAQHAQHFDKLSWHIQQLYTRS